MEVGIGVEIGLELEAEVEIEIEREEEKKGVWVEFVRRCRRGWGVLEGRD